MCKVTSGIYYFLTLFQLLHHLSERAISSLLGFIRLLLQYIGMTISNNILLEIAAAIPKTMQMIRATYKQDHVTEYVVCPKCDTLYVLSECITHERNEEKSKKCNAIQFPNHPHVSKRAPCNEILLKKIKVGSKYKLVARKAYIYRSIVHTLQDMAKRKGFMDKCNLWRNRSSFYWGYIMMVEYGMISRKSVEDLS